MKQFIILLATVILVSCGSSTGEAVAIDTLKVDSIAVKQDTVKVDSTKVDTTTKVVK
jgi:hypothetical protein